MTRRAAGPPLTPDEYVDAIVQIAERDAVAQRISERLGAALPSAPGGPTTPPSV